MDGRPVGRGDRRVVSRRIRRRLTLRRSLADFAELVAMAIANADARDELMASRARDVDCRRRSQASYRA